MLSAGSNGIMQKLRAAADDLIPIPHNLPSADEMFRKATQENYRKFVYGTN